jgi:hypothetical protein
MRERAPKTILFWLKKWESIAVWCYNMFVCMNSFEMGKSYFSSFYLQREKLRLMEKGLSSGERVRVSKEEIFIRFWLNKKALKLMTIEENALTSGMKKKGFLSHNRYSKWKFSLNFNHATCECSHFKFFPTITKFFAFSFSSFYP